MNQISDRIPVRLFVSYAHRDDSYADPLMASFREMVTPSKKYRFDCWRDPAILTGEVWAEAIQNAIQACDAGLLLVSPAFLGSPFISREELPGFIGDSAKPVFPVMLRQVNLLRHDLKGLENHQIFSLKTAPDRYKSYAQCGSRQKNEFVFELYEAIESRMDKIFV